MALQIGIVGLPNVGKSTLFNALTRSKGAEAANYPFCTIDPNVGIVEVPDERLNKLAELVKPEKTIPTIIEFVDIAGLVKGASKGEGLGNAFLSHIREVDAICHVVRVFQSGDIIHVEGTVDPKRDREIIEMELILADFASIEKRKDKLEGKARAGDKEGKIELAVLTKVMATLEAGKLVSSVDWNEEEKVIVKNFQLLTSKPVLYALNVSEQELGTIDLNAAKAQAGITTETAILVSAKLEEELINLSPEEAKGLLKDLGVQSSGLDQLIKSAYDILGLQTFFTAGEKEVRAWTVQKGAKAPQCAGVIHTDFERGFIRAETIAYEDFAALGSEQAAKEAGKLRTEGKEYTAKDGDIFHFRFNV